MISSKEVKKEYLAICANLPIINGKKMNSGTLKTDVISHGKTQNAKTFFNLEKEFFIELPNFDVSCENSSSLAKPPVSCNKVPLTQENATYSKKLPLYLIRLTLETGRMHQIRVQMANAKSPLLADDKYGDFKLNKILRKVGIKKLQLASVKLTLPINKKIIVLECKLPQHIQNVLDKGLSE